VFGEDVLMNICVEKHADGKLSGCIRIKDKIKGMVLSLGRTLSQVIPLLIEATSCLAADVCMN
jgi:coatomer subunit beta